MKSPPRHPFPSSSAQHSICGPFEDAVLLSKPSSDLPGRCAVDVSNMSRHLALHSWILLAISLEVQDHSLFELGATKGTTRSTRILSPAILLLAPPSDADCLRRCCFDAFQHDVIRIEVALQTQLRLGHSIPH